MATTAVACGGLVGYGLVRYPGLITGAATWMEVAAFLAVLAGYTVAAGVVVRRLDRPALHAVHLALIGATLIGALWFVIGLTASFGASDYIATLLLVALPLASLSVGAIGTWRGDSVRTGQQSAVVSAIGAGMLVFIVWIGDTLVTAGRPYDPGMIRDFHSSGARDLATYAVSDNMGSGMMLMLLVPLLAVTIGVGAAAITSRLRFRAPTSD